MKATKLAAGLALAFAGLSGSAQAASNIVFDMDGAGGAYAPTTISSFDWDPGNALSIGSIGSVSALPSGTSTQLVYQAALATFNFGNTKYLAPAGKEFTIQASFWEVGTGLGGTTAAFTFDNTKPSWVKIWYGNADRDDKTGTGYNNGTLILQGEVAKQSGNITNFTAMDPTNFPLVGLDQALGDGDDDGGVLSVQSNGGFNIDVKVNSTDSNFFKSDVTSLAIGMFFNGNLHTPFDSVNPSDQVVGFTPVYGAGGAVNGVFCGTGVASCDFHFLADANNTFDAKVPEPASMALIGLGLSAMGFAARRRRTN